MESEFCEIDFTTATMWENFTARLEEIFYSWKLYQSEEDCILECCEIFSCELGSWSLKKEKISLGGKEFEIFYYQHQDQLKNEINDTNKKEESEITPKKIIIQNDLSLNYLPLELNCLSKNISKFDQTKKLIKLIRLYNLKHFVLLFPVNDAVSIVSSESYVKFLMSSFYMSAFNTRCFIPIFAQIFQLWQNCFIGVRVDEDGFREDYQMIHLAKVPSKLQYFSGFLDLLKSKVALMSFTNSIWASVKFSYSITKFTSFSYLVERNVNFDESTDLINYQSFCLPFEAVCESINEIRLHVAWPKVYENMVMDNENHSDFDPLYAPNWFLQIFSENKQHHLLTQHITQFLEICQSSFSISELIGDLLKRKNFNGDLNVPSNLSISKIISVSSLPNSNNSNSSEVKRSKRFLPEETLVTMLYYLFPDADHNSTYPYITNSSEDSKENSSLKGMKTCCVGELPWRLSLIMCSIVYLYGEFAAAQFWYEFIEELRFRWDKSLRLLGVQKGIPNHKTSLINQKLQMLNCCILKRMKRENIEILSEDSDEQINSCPNSGVPGKFESEDEEFFDCQTESKEIKEEFDFNVARVSLWNQPEGRLRKFNNLRLIETGDYMYIPITQEMTPKTEDQLEDDAVVLMKLGSDSEGSKLRARMMCASLYSDMESFKAANPGAVLEDFIRWYSPRDWIESSELDKYGQKKGKLSNRMLIPGNMWKEVWDTSIPVPASRQKCLFDDNKESEKVLHFFESHKNLADVFYLLLPTLLHAALYTIINDENVKFLRRYSSYLDDKISVLIQKVVSATRNITFDLSLYKIVVDEIKEIEDIVMRFKSLKIKLFPWDLSENEELRNIMMELILGEKQIIIPDGPHSLLGRQIIFLFSKETEQSLPENNLEKLKSEADSFSVNTTNVTNEFLHTAMLSIKDTVSSKNNKENASNTITVSPYQKEFILHISSALPFASSRVSSHKLTAHVCSEEIFIASNFCHDSIFV